MLLFVSDANLPVRFTSEHILLPLSDYDPPSCLSKPFPFLNKTISASTVAHSASTSPRVLHPAVSLPSSCSEPGHSSMTHSPHTRTHHSASRTTHRLCTSHSHLEFHASARSSISSSPTLSTDAVCVETRSLESCVPSDTHGFTLMAGGLEGSVVLCPHPHHSINAKLTTAFPMQALIPDIPVRVSRFRSALLVFE